MATGRTTGRIVFILLLAAFTLPGAGCSPGSPEIAIEGQQAALSPIIVGAGSVFMKVRNSGSGDDTLLRAQADITNTVIELHAVDDEGKMVKTDRIPIPAQSVVQLRPAGFHLMIFRMPKSVQEGHQFNLTLSFEKSGNISIPIQFITIATARSKDRDH